MKIIRNEVAVSKTMKIKLFTHTDLDGVGCAVLAYLAFGRENVDIEYCNYDDIDEKVMKFLESNTVPYNMYYITDISVSEKVAKEIDSRSWKEKVRLFDHHKTAEYLNKFDWCEVMDFIPFTDHLKTSGTQIFYTYLRSQCTCLDSLSDKVRLNMSKFVNVVRDYDTWRWKELGEEGIICKKVNDLFYIYGRDKFIRWITHQIHTFINPKDVCFSWENKQFPEFSSDDKAVLDQKQKDIDIYIDEKDKQLVQITDIFGNIYGVVFAERYISELGNRLCELHPELAYIAMIDICKGRVSYRTVREGIDLGGEIANSFGGGGHTKAAGSTFDRKAVIEIVTDIVFNVDR